MKDFDYAAWKAMADARQCLACVFYVPHSVLKDGWCRRFPPQGGDGESWPRVDFDDWCGEFALNPDAGKK